MSQASRRRFTLMCTSLAPWTTPHRTMSKKSAASAEVRSTCRPAPWEASPAAVNCPRATISSKGAGSAYRDGCANLYPPERTRRLTSSMGSPCRYSLTAKMVTSPLSSSTGHNRPANAARSNSRAKARAKAGSRREMSSAVCSSRGSRVCVAVARAFMALPFPPSGRRYGLRRPGASARRHLRWKAVDKHLPRPALQRVRHGPPGSAAIHH
ncbi:hypothetical protein G6F35_015486 [Rhizopus arrhizus]|nr:hypothetical protein G6F35_015486 [Rhizopus arrhizus]